MQQGAVDFMVIPGSSGILSYYGRLHCPKGVRLEQCLLYFISVRTRVHKNQSVQLGWVAVTAEFRDYIILVM